MKKPALPRALYTPGGRAFEYGALAANPFAGCGFSCAYCYVSGAIRMPRHLFDAGATEKPRFAEALRRDAEKLLIRGERHQVFFCFSSDPFPNDATRLTADCMASLAEYGQASCVLTKAGLRALQYMSLFRPTRDCIAATLTSADAAFAAKWEPKAAPPSERLAMLRAFYEAGIWTWASLEPVLSAEHSLAALEASAPFTQHYKIGAPTGIKQPHPYDQREFVRRAIDILVRRGRTAYFKETLAPFVPAGWDNQMRVRQHH